MRAIEGRILLLSGIDPTGEAGLLLDTQVAARFGAAPCGVPTCLVDENVYHVKKVIPIERAVFGSLLNSVLEEGSVKATKIGLVPEGSLKWFADLIREKKKLLGKIVLDPVLSASVGFPFHESVSSDFLSLFSQAYIVTPNFEEAKRIAGYEKDLSVSVSIEEIAMKLMALGPEAVLITGERVSDERIRDRFFRGRSSKFFDNLYVQRKVRGTGCALSTALASLICAGARLTSAVEKSIEFVKEAIELARPVSDKYFQIRFSVKKSNEE